MKIDDYHERLMNEAILYELQDSRDNIIDDLLEGSTTINEIKDRDYHLEASDLLVKIKAILLDQ